MSTETTTNAQAVRDAALAALLDTRAAVEAARAAEQTASTAWLAAICASTSKAHGYGSMCCEAIGHDGPHRNLLGDEWTTAYPRQDQR